MTDLKKIEATKFDFQKKIQELVVFLQKHELYPQQKEYKTEIVWRNVFLIAYLHIAGTYGLFVFFFRAKWSTFIMTVFLLIMGGIGHAAGSHRLWTHRSYKANFKLRVMLAFFCTLAFENDIHEWVRDHRVHHRYTDSNADPHNPKRGLFYAHCGWLMCKKQEEVKEKGKLVDLSDIEADPVVMFQKKYYKVLMPLCCFIIPAAIPWYFFGETEIVAWHVALAKYFLTISGTWAINSLAHTYGRRPYDRNIQPTDNVWVNLLTFGEGGHNFHHVFPWDYRSAEDDMNTAALFIKLMAKIGWATDLKYASDEVILKRKMRTGDEYGKAEINPRFMPDDSNTQYIWGWQDDNLTKDHIKEIDVIYVDQQQEEVDENENVKLLKENNAHEKLENEKMLKENKDTNLVSEKSSIPSSIPAKQG